MTAEHCALCTRLLSSACFTILLVFQNTLANWLSVFLLFFVFLFEAVGGSGAATDQRASPQKEIQSGGLGMFEGQGGKKRKMAPWRALYLASHFAAQLDQKLTGGIQKNHGGSE